MTILQPFGELKFRQGVDQTFEWTAPCAVEGTPEVTFTLSGSTVTGSMSSVHSGSITAIDVERDRRKLTIVEDTDTAGLQRRYGDAWITTDTDGAYPVKITKISGSVLTLADHLPGDISLTPTNSGSIHFSSFYFVLPSGSVTAEVQRDIIWTVEYDSFYGTDTPDIDNLREEGLLHVVNQPFDTGLTHNKLVSSLPYLGGTLPSKQSDYSPQIQMAFNEMILHVRRDLGPTYTEDNIPASTLFLPAHISFTQAIIDDSTNPDAADRFREQAKDRLRMAMEKFWLDINADNVVDEGEELSQVTNNSTDAVGHSNYTTTDQASMDWYIGVYN